MSSKRWEHNGGHLLIHNSIIYCGQCWVFLFSKNEPCNPEDVNIEECSDYSIFDPTIETPNELHPLLVYENMLKERHIQTYALHDTAFEYK